MTPLHYSIEANNTRVIDLLVSVLADADFDHHSAFTMELLPTLVELSPESLTKYLDKRMK